MDADTSPLTPRSRALRRRQAKPKRLPTANVHPLTYVVRAELAFTQPPIWRRLELDSDLRLDQVHAVLQAAFEWDGHHLHEFSQYDGEGRVPSRTFKPASRSQRGDDATPEHKIRLNQVLGSARDQLHYVYDFGDNWHHVLTLEEVKERSATAPPARVVGGERSAPPDDCGGPLGYNHLCEVLDDPSHPEHDAMSERFEEVTWMSPVEFDPEWFDAEEIDEVARRALL